MRIKTVAVLLAALVCSACASQSPTKTTTNESQQYSAIQWDQLVAANNMAKVNNSGLITMR